MVEAPSVERAELVADRLVAEVGRACGGVEAPPPTSWAENAPDF
jgi:hypothetical protein